MAASPVHLFVHDLGAHSSHRDLDQRARPSERGGRVDDIEALENIDLLRDKIFQRLQNVDKGSKGGLPPRSPAPGQLGHGSETQKSKMEVSDGRMSMTDDVMIESIQSMAEEEKTGGSERSTEGLRQNDYTRQFSNSSDAKKEDGAKQKKRKGK